MQATLEGLIMGQINCGEEQTAGYHTVNRRYVYAALHWCTNHYSEICDSVRLAHASAQANGRKPAGHGEAHSSAGERDAALDERLACHCICHGHSSKCFCSRCVTLERLLGF
jgi:hypothetical protein